MKALRVTWNMKVNNLLKNTYGNKIQHLLLIFIDSKIVYIWFQNVIRKK